MSIVSELDADLDRFADMERTRLAITRIQIAIVRKWVEITPGQSGRRIGKFSSLSAQEFAEQIRARGIRGFSNARVRQLWYAGETVPKMQERFEAPKEDPRHVPIRFAPKVAKMSPDEQTTMATETSAEIRASIASPQTSVPESGPEQARKEALIKELAENVASPDLPKLVDERAVIRALDDLIRETWRLQEHPDAIEPIYRPRIIEAATRARVAIEWLMALNEIAELYDGKEDM